MTPYSYRATTAEGRIVEGVMEADAESAVVATLRSQGFIPLYVGTKGKASGPRRAVALRLPDFSAWRGRIKSRDLMVFTRELATLLHAGMPLDRSLQSLAALTENTRLRDVIANVLTQVQEGKSLSRALNEHARVFPPLYINMVRAGEAGGVREAVLDSLAD